METKPNSIFKPDNARLCLRLRFKTMLARRLGEPLLGAIKNKYLSVSLKVSLYRKRTDVDKKIKSW